MISIKKIIIFLFLSLFLFIGCTDNKVSNEKNLKNRFIKLNRYFPNYQFQGEYKGNGNYYHEIKIKNINYLRQKIIYYISGEVLSKEDDIEYKDSLFSSRYILDNSGVIEETFGKNLLKSKYKQLYILKFPIDKGNVWKEKVKGRDGKSYILNSEITSINDTIDGKEVEIIYKEKGSSYYEKRVLKDNLGVISFTKRENYNDEYFDIGFKLEHFKFNNLYSEKYIVSELYETLINYNIAWQNFFNNRDLEIKNYLFKDSKIFNRISSFKKKLKQKIIFETLEIEKIEKDGKGNYFVAVKEEYTLSEGDLNKKVFQNIKYKIKKVEEKFLIYNYEHIKSE